jgi:hypothetical protein
MALRKDYHKMFQSIQTWSFPGSGIRNFELLFIEERRTTDSNIIDKTD